MLIPMLITIVVILVPYLDARINGHVFLTLDESRLKRFSVSVGFEFAIMNIIKDMVSSWESLQFSITSAQSCYVATEKQPSTSQ